MTVEFIRTPAELMVFGELDVIRAMTYHARDRVMHILDCMDQEGCTESEDRLRFLHVMGQLSETIRILDDTMERIA